MEAKYTIFWYETTGSGFEPSVPGLMAGVLTNWHANLSRNSCFTGPVIVFEPLPDACLCKIVGRFFLWLQCAKYHYFDAKPIGKTSYKDAMCQKNLGEFLWWIGSLQSRRGEIFAVFILCCIYRILFFSFSFSMPAYFVVPATVKDNELTEASLQFNERRLPVSGMFVEFT